MSNALSIFETPKLELPAHIARFQEQASNIEARTTVPSLGIEGKVFTISMNGEKRKLVRRDDEGDEVPIAVLRTVIIDFAKRRGRTYYEGGYDPAKPAAPVCWSEDGVKPHDKVEKKQAATCDKCPLSAKGSKVTDNGKSTTACSQHRMVALVPASNLEHEPLRLKLAITSDWDKQNPELEQQGWFGFQNYTDFLRSKGITHTATVITKLRFDPNVAYPKLIFSPDRFLDDDSVRLLAPIAKSDKVKELLSATWTPAGVDGVKTDAPEAFVQPAIQIKPATTAKPIDDEDVEIIPPKKEAKKKAKVVDDDDGGIPEMLRRTETKKPTASAKPPVEVDLEADPEITRVLPAAAIKAATLEALEEAARATASTTPKKTVAKKAEPAKSEELPEDVADLLEEWPD